MAIRTTAEQTPAQVLTQRRRRTIALGVISAVAVVLFSVVAVSAWNRVDSNSNNDCGDVGVTGPAASTPEDALSAWLVGPEAEGQPEMSAWRISSTGDDTARYQNTEAKRRAYHPEDGYHTVDVTRTSAGWSVAGACV
jgi:hypothetical protein